MGYKIERLQQVIKFKVSQVIHRDLSDPRIGLLTITYVKLAKDLSNCTVGYSMLGGDGDRNKCERALNDACGFIQKEVASALATRKSPQIRFTYDESIEGSARISEILRRELDQAVDSGAEADDADLDDADENEPTA
ncbi:MAG: ribosome-binding factor A [Planctomycetota bacterium]|jgi:ribosome-binding factor A